MALQKTIIVNGLTATDAYHKITRLLTSDVASEEGKTYKTEVMVKSFANDTKENEIKVQYFNATSDSEEDLTYGAFYTFLKAQAFFEGAEDV